MDTQSGREDAGYDAFDELDEMIAGKIIKQAEFITEAEKLNVNGILIVNAGISAFICAENFVCNNF